MLKCVLQNLQCISDTITKGYGVLLNKLHCYIGVAVTIRVAAWQIQSNSITSGVTARDRGAQCPPDAAQRENQPTNREKRGVMKKRKGRKRERKEEKKILVFPKYQPKLQQCSLQMGQI